MYNKSIKIKNMKNWRTTLSGIVIGAYPVYDALYSAFVSGQFKGKHGLELALGIGVIALGVLAKDRPTPPPTKMLIVLALSSAFSSSKAQSIWKPIPRPDAHSLPVAIKRFRATSLSIELDSVFQGLRIGGPTVLVALPDFTVFTGVGIEYQHSTFSVTSGRWVKQWGIGASLFAGGQFAPANIRSATAAGVHLSFLDGFLTVGLLYNITTRKIQEATGPMTQLFPSN
jgi:hypothetical protein